MEIEEFFPVRISYSFNPNHSQIKDHLIQHCLFISTNYKSGGTNWISDKTYNTSDGVYDCYNDTEFLNLNKWVRDEVKTYANLLDIDENLDVVSAWFNIYNKHDYQEFHKHPGYKLSAIYVLECCSHSDSIIYFKTPADEMYNLTYKNVNKKNSQIISHQSIPGKLIIFPSNIAHCVSKNNSVNKRISLSYNFTSKVGC
jgi:uncharacterized protein (TIGR02466 family)